MGRDRREILKLWVADETDVQAYVDATTYRDVPGFSRKVVICRLERLGEQELRENLVESWTARATARLRKAGIA